MRGLSIVPLGRARGLAVLSAGLALWLATACGGQPASPAAPAAVPPPVDSAAPGRLVAAQSAVDLGRVPFERTVEGRFELSNTGSGPVRLVGKPQVKTLDGC